MLTHSMLPLFLDFDLDPKVSFVSGINSKIRLCTSPFKALHTQVVVMLYSSPPPYFFHLILFEQCEKTLVVNGR